MYVLTVSTYTEKTIGMAPYLIACSMQHVSTVSTYLGSCKSWFSCISVFGRKVFLIFPITYQTVDLNLICIIGQPDLINPLILPISTLDHIFTHFGDFFSSFMVSWLLNLIETRCVSFWLISTVSTLQIALKLLKLNNPSCQNLSFWWLCGRLTRSTTPWWIKSGPSMSN